MQTSWLQENEKRGHVISNQWFQSGRGCGETGEIGQVTVHNNSHQNGPNRNETETGNGQQHYQALQCN